MVRSLGHVSALTAGKAENVQVEEELTASLVDWEKSLPEEPYN